jgi:hypothetical protein
MCVGVVCVCVSVSRIKYSLDLIYFLSAQWAFVNILAAFLLVAESHVVAWFNDEFRLLINKRIFIFKRTGPIEQLADNNNLTSKRTAV